MIFTLRVPFVPFFIQKILRVSYLLTLHIHKEYDVLSALEQFTFYLYLPLRISQFMSHSAIFHDELISSELGSMSAGDKLPLVPGNVGWVIHEEKIQKE